MAVGAEGGEAALNVASNQDSSSLLALSGIHRAAYPETSQQGEVRVTVRRLDEVLDGDCLPRPSLLKVDVQGFELQVLRGAEGLLGAFENVYVECGFTELYAGQPNVAEVVCFFRDRGLSPSGVFSPEYDGAGRCLQADILFRR